MAGKSMKIPHLRWFSLAMELLNKTINWDPPPKCWENLRKPYLLNNTWCSSLTPPVRTSEFSIAMFTQKNKKRKTKYWLYLLLLFITQYLVVIKQLLLLTINYNNNGWDVACYLLVVNWCKFPHGPRHLQTLRASVALRTSNSDREIIGRSCGEGCNGVCIYIYIYVWTNSTCTDLAWRKSTFNMACIYICICIVKTCVYSFHRFILKPHTLQIQCETQYARWQKSLRPVSPSSEVHCYPSNPTRMLPTRQIQGVFHRVDFES